MAKQASKYRDEDRSLDLYLREIGETPLINAAEEVRLAKKIKTGSKEALEALTKANLRFVVSVAKQYQNQGLSLADLINEGNIGLIKAAKRFDETRGFKFISYAVWWRTLESEKALDTLTPREAEVISLYFGLNHEKAVTLEEIGARFMLTRERVRQIKEKAIRRLRHASRSRSLRAYLN